MTIEEIIEQSGIGQIDVEEYEDLYIKLLATKLSLEHSIYGLVKEYEDKLTECMIGILNSLPDLELLQLFESLVTLSEQLFVRINKSVCESLKVSDFDKQTIVLMATTLKALNEKIEEMRTRLNQGE